MAASSFHVNSHQMVRLAKTTPHTESWEYRGVHVFVMGPIKGKYHATFSLAPGARSETIGARTLEGVLGHVADLIDQKLDGGHRRNTSADLGGNRHEMVRVSKDPGRAGMWEYRRTKIWVSGPVGGRWLATVQNAARPSVESRTLEGALANAADLIDEDIRSTFEQKQSLRKHGYTQNTMRTSKDGEYEFKVKLSMRVRGVNISNDELQMETEYAVDSFARSLRKAYPWVGRVGLTGRSGGWLLIEDKKGEATEDELSDINDRVDEARKDFEQVLIDTFGYTENRSRSHRPNAVDPKLRKAYDFFREQGGGRVGHSAEGAINLARAEKIAEGEGWEAEWEDDPEEWDGDTERPFEVLNCLLKDEQGDVIASLGSIGMSGNARQDRDYTRLVEAELALEAALEKGLL